MRIAIVNLLTTCVGGMEGQEIIKLVALACDVSEDGVNFKDTFTHYVRPTGNPTLTADCVRMTGIEQQCVTEQQTLNEVLQSFGRWILENEIIAWCSWENARSQLIIECRMKELINPLKHYKHFDLKMIFSQKFGWRVDALRALDIRKIATARTLLRWVDDTECVAALLIIEAPLRKVLLNSLKPRIERVS